MKSCHGEKIRLPVSQQLGYRPLGEQRIPVYLCPPGQEHPRVGPDGRPDAHLKAVKYPAAPQDTVGIYEGDRHQRRLGAQGQQRRPTLELLQAPLPSSPPLRENPYHLTLPQQTQGMAHGRQVYLPSPHGKGAETPQHQACHRDAEQLFFGHKIYAAG